MRLKQIAARLIELANEEAGAYEDKDTSLSTELRELAGKLEQESAAEGMLLSSSRPDLMYAMTIAPLSAEPEAFVFPKATPPVPLRPPPGAGWVLNKTSPFGERGLTLIWYRENPEGRSAIYDAIDLRRAHQDDRWGGAEHDDAHAPKDWQTWIVNCALGRRYDGSMPRTFETPSFFIDKMTDVAALAIAAIESTLRLQRGRFSAADLEPIARRIHDAHAAATGAAIALPEEPVLGVGWIAAARAAAEGPLPLRTSDLAKGDLVPELKVLTTLGAGPEDEPGPLAIEREAEGTWKSYAEAHAITSPFSAAPAAVQEAFTEAARVQLIAERLQAKALQGARTFYEPGAIATR
jgi:hypothetical protein